MDKQQVQDFMSDRVHLINGKHYKLNPKYKKTRWRIRITLGLMILALFIGIVILFNMSEMKSTKVILLGISIIALIVNAKYCSYAKQFIPENYMHDLVEVYLPFNK